MNKIYRNLAGSIKVLVIKLLKNRILYVFIVVFIISLLSLLAGGKDKVAPRYLNNPNEEIIQASDYFKVHPQDKNIAVIDIGLYLDSIYNLDLANVSFNARGWIWYSWDKYPNINGKTGIKENVGIFDLNLHEESSSFQQKTLNSPIFEDGLGYWNETTFDAKFVGNKINLRNFPFDTQKLQIIVTSNLHETEELVFNPIQFRLPSKAFNILGYKLDGLTIEDTVIVYSSNFYDASIVDWRDRMSSGGHYESAATTQSQSVFSVYISKEIFTSMIEFVFPLLIVSLLGTLVSFLGADQPEIKLGAPPAAILSLIFLQDSFMGALPRTSYLTCMDLLFLIAYLACFLSFLNSLLERLDKNYFRYQFLFRKLGILVVLASPIFAKTWLWINA